MIQCTNSLSRNGAACPSCGRICEAGKTWKGANYCRGLSLLRFIEDDPGRSAWELSQLSGLPYVDATRGLLKLRDYGAVRIDPEEQEQGGVRYRYFPAGDTAVRARFVQAVRRAEAL